MSEQSINQIYIEIISNIIRKQNYYLLLNICDKEKLPYGEIMYRYIPSKIAVKNLLSQFKDSDSD
jgi:hypothetical protein